MCLIYMWVKKIVFVLLERYAKKYPEKLIESQEGVRLCENPRGVMEFVVLLLNKVK